MISAENQHVRLQTRTLLGDVSKANGEIPPLAGKIPHPGAVPRTGFAVGGEPADQRGGSRVSSSWAFLAQ